MATIEPRQVALRDGRTVTLRHGTPRDAAGCLRYVHAVLPESDHFSMMPDEFSHTVEQEAQWLKKNLDDPNSIILLAELDGEIVGLLDFRRSRFRKCAHHGSFGVSLRKALHGQGVGTVMVQMLIGWAKANPTIEFISLEAYSTNTRALDFYRRLGFVECGRLPRCHKLGPGEYADDVQMVLRTDGG